MARPLALLLVGPTGSGKTPVGRRIEAEGLGKARAAHLDFGECLRLVARRGAGTFGLSTAQVAIVEQCLRTGALLEDDNFPIAEQIVNEFVRSHGLETNGLVLLNGLPRHVGQAAAVSGIVQVRAVTYLSCNARTVHERIALDTGGDRAGRADDSLPAVATKLRIFEERTRPLLGFYASRGVPILRIPVASDTSPEQSARTIIDADEIRSVCTGADVPARSMQRS